MKDTGLGKLQKLRHTTNVIYSGSKAVAISKHSSDSS